jgi:hypothetical protein
MIRLQISEMIMIVFPIPLIWGLKSCYMGLKHVLPTYLGCETRLIGACSEKSGNRIVEKSGFLKVKRKNGNPR